MPTVQSDGRVIWVTNAPTDIDTRIALHGLPTAVLSTTIAKQNLLVLRGSHSVGVAGANVNGFATGAVAELGPVWLTAVSTP